MLVLAAAQLWTDLTGVYLVRAADLGLTETTLQISRILLFTAGIVLVGYALVSWLVATAVRRWAASVPVPGGTRNHHRAWKGEARRLAVVEVARCAVRRDYARVARAAADTLEQSAIRASATAYEFGQRRGTPRQRTRLSRRSIDPPTASSSAVTTA